MIKIITIYNDNTNEINIKYESTEHLYKKCNYKNDNNFNIIKTFSYNDYIIELWGKINGTKQFKNKNYLLVNNQIDIYGKCIFIKKNIQTNLYQSLLLSEFNEVFNKDINNDINKDINNDINKDINNDINNDINKDTDDDVNNYDYSSSDTELTYDVYSYSSDEEIK